MSDARQPHPDRSIKVNNFAREISDAIRHVLGLTGPPTPGWFRPSQLTKDQMDQIKAATWPIIRRFAVGRAVGDTKA